MMTRLDWFGHKFQNETRDYRLERMKNLKMLALKQDLHCCYTKLSQQRLAYIKFKKSGTVVASFCHCFVDPFPF